jgi:hypothetical protein
MKCPEQKRQCSEPTRDTHAEESAAFEIQHGTAS